MKISSYQLQWIPILGILITYELSKRNHQSFLDNQSKFIISGIYQSIFIFLLLKLLINL